MRRKEIRNQGKIKDRDHDNDKKECKYGDTEKNGKCRHNCDLITATSHKQKTPEQSSLKLQQGYF
jgi:hypothetical protein